MWSEIDKNLYALKFWPKVPRGVWGIYPKKLDWPSVLEVHVWLDLAQITFLNWKLLNLIRKERLIHDDLLWQLVQTQLLANISCQRNRLKIEVQKIKPFEHGRSSWWRFVGRCRHPRKRCWHDAVGGFICTLQGSEFHHGSRVGVLWYQISTKSIYSIF